MVDYYFQEITLYAMISLLVWKIIELTSLNWVLALVIALPLAILIVATIHAIETYLNNLAMPDDENRSDEQHTPNIFLRVISFVQIFILLSFIVILYQIIALLQFWLSWTFIPALIASVPITIGLLIIPALVQDMFYKITGISPPLLMYGLYEVAAKYHRKKN